MAKKRKRVPLREQRTKCFRREMAAEMRKLEHKTMPRKQKVAIGLSVARRKCRGSSHRK